MKRLLFLSLLLLLFFPLCAGPCYEELETVSLVTLSSRASVPLLPLEGVSFIGDEDKIIPDKIVYSSSDASTYLEALNTKPKCSILESALYSITQNGATMKRTKKMLQERNYQKGELVVTGAVTLTTRSELDKMDIILTGNLSSFQAYADLDLVIVSGSEVYSVKGKLDIEGGDDKIFTISSSDYTVNGIKYDVELKYRLRKA